MPCIAFTGKPKIEGTTITRDLLIELAGENGFYVQDKVDYRTSYLVASSPDFKGGKGKKITAAKQYGTPIISIDQFLKLIGKS